MTLFKQHSTAYHNHIPINSLPPYSINFIPNFLKVDEKSIRNDKIARVTFIQ